VQNRAHVQQSLLVDVRADYSAQRTIIGERGDMGRTAHTPCDEPGCDRSPANGDVLYRVNPKGARTRRKKGLFGTALGYRQTGERE
jgi:hypothetical protein